MRFNCISIVLFSGLLCLILQIVANPVEPEQIGLRKIVVFKAEVSDEAQQKNVVAAANCKVIKGLKLINAQVVLLPAEAAEKAKAMETLSRSPEVLRVDNDDVLEAVDAPKPDTLAAKPTGKPKPPPTKQPAQVLPWGVDRIDAELAWQYSTGSQVKVAVLDTGIDLDHPDLQANIKGGYNAINPNRKPDDKNGHGTHIAGIIAAINNSIGVVGASHQAFIYAVQVLDASGSGWLSDIIEGIDWCIQNSMQVTNMSFGGTSDNLSFQEAIKRANEAGITQVAAAGNDYDGVRYPAKYPEVICVTAIDSTDSFATWSNYGPEVDLTAPGVDIYSTYKNASYATLSGTSMAAPHVAAACALKLAQNPTLSPTQVLDALKATAELLPNLTSEQQGAGLVDAEKLVKP